MIRRLLDAVATSRIRRLYARRSTHWIAVQ